MSDANRVGIRYQKSTERDVPITLSPNELEALRVTGTPGLAFTPNTIASQEIRPDRQVTDLILVGAEAGGDVGFELSAGTFDDLIESALLSSWNSAASDVGNTAITAFAAGQITVDDGSIYKVGHVVRIYDLATGDVGDGVYYITGIVTNDLSVTPLDADTSAIAGTETADADTTLRVVGLRAASAGDLDITVSGSALQVTAPAGFFDDAMTNGTNLVVGQWAKLHNFDTAGNNVWGRITAVAGNQLDLVAPSSASTEVTTGNGVVFFGDYVRNGADAISSHQYAVERRFEDHSPVTRELFLGMVVGALNLQLSAQAIATGTVSFTGLNSEVDDVASNLYSGGTPTDIDADQFDVMNTSSDVGRIGRGADPVDASNANFVLEASIDLNNNLRPQPAIGTLGAVAIGAGELTITGNLNTYFDDKSILELLLDNTETSFDIAVAGGDGRGFVFDMPRIKFATGSPDVQAKNTDALLSMTYQALRDETLEYMIHVQRFHYSK